MLSNTILSWTLLLSFSTALTISSHLSTETALQCSTLYSTSSPSSLSTITASSHQTIELSPVILHNYTTSTITYTPKPFETLFSVLATKTKTVEREAVNGTLQVQVTTFGTRTFWHHITVTKTVTKQRLLTSRTTKWVEAPTGFVGVRNGTFSEEKPKRQLSEEANMAGRSAPSTSSKRMLQKPTKGKFAVAVECVQQIRIHTTETLLLEARTKATITAKQETVFKNRTVYGTVTSTILALSSSNTTSIPSVSGSASGVSSTTPLSSNTKTDKGHSIPTTPTPSTTPSPSPSPSPLPQTLTEITTNTTTITKTPYTISFTWTSTSTSTTTQTLHATTTLTSYAACASGNLLSQTSNNQRINGISFFDEEGEGSMAGRDVQVEEVEVGEASGCCEKCVQRKGCLWSIYEASGERQGSCYLILLNNDTNANTKRGKEEGTVNQKDEQGKETAETIEEKQAGSCNTQQQKGTFGYTAANGEVRYVVSNGLCGLLIEA